ncbi:MAG: M20/M25/M40 family metallo-hydrolase [Myxococcota bacterium]
MATLSARPLDEIASLSRAHLEAVVAIESSSDENSATVPSTEGQRALSQYLERFFADLGCEVRVDEHANVIARMPGRGAHADVAPLALMIHLDTARGTEARDGLELLPAWDGTRIPYPANETLQVSVENYPCTAGYVGQDLLHGSGTAPFGLDDKLGLAHMMTLARLLADDTSIPHRPILFIGRPDEEIGREDALIGLAEWLAEQGVDSGYTVDGLDPFEVNLENFNGMAASLRFVDREGPRLGPGGTFAAVTLLGVNTHGATAKAEGHRGAVRFAAELMQALEGQSVTAFDFESDAVRDCDGVLRVWLADDAARARLEAALAEVVGPHVPRGAGWAIADDAGTTAPHAHATQQMLAFVSAFMASRTDVPLMCEDSEGFDGYTYPYRARVVDGQLQLDVRIRDFDRDALSARRDHLFAVASALDGDIALSSAEQYGNMAPKLAQRQDLLETALQAAGDVGIEAKRLPIRGGTGVDPFLDRGVFVANLGTGYFAPESEKEFTSMQLLAKHALWLLALVQR